jgi:formate-dependent nitrite reductase membrane component NrfD
VSEQPRGVLMLAISLATAACSACLCVLAVLYWARAASRSFALTFLVFGTLAAVMAVRITVVRAGIPLIFYPSR